MCTPKAVDDDADVVVLDLDVGAYHRHISTAEQTRDFRVLCCDLTEADGCLTPTPNVRHSRVVEDVDALYRS